MPSDFIRTLSRIQRFGDNSDEVVEKLKYKIISVKQNGKEIEYDDMVNEDNVYVVIDGFKRPKETTYEISYSVLSDGFYRLDYGAKSNEQKKVSHEDNFILLYKIKNDQVSLDIFNASVKLKIDDKYLYRNLSSAVSYKNGNYKYVDKFLNDKDKVFGFNNLLSFNYFYTFIPVRRQQIEKDILSDMEEIFGSLGNLPAFFEMLLWITYIFFVLSFIKYGIDDKIGTITPRFSLKNKDISPAFANVLINSFCTDYKQGFIATLVDLITRGYILRLGDDKNLILKRTDKPYEKGLEEERIILDTIFKYKDEVNFSLSKKDASTASFGRVGDALRYQTNILKVKKEKYVSMNPFLCGIGFCLTALLLTSYFVSHLSGLSMILGFLLYLPYYIKLYDSRRILFYTIVVFFGGLYILFNSGAGIGMLASSGLGQAFFILDFGVIFLTFFILLSCSTYIYLMEKPNKRGIKTIREIEDFKMFITKINQYRLDLITPGLFFENLPYAFVFFFEKEWVNYFNFDVKDKVSKEDIKKSEALIHDLLRIFNFMDSEVFY
ncbi:MAG: hypothetical protein BWY78_00655 [Alphaproteobacteria bacterium ADurb.Bin438]|nr:MAG: hypothetical protein BWY78_00655 [Alphaproteobacteria bacterium ADurb.Bin438]